jgi:hypothetical protein
METNRSPLLLAVAKTEEKVPRSCQAEVLDELACENALDSLKVVLSVVEEEAVSAAEVSVLTPCHSGVLASMEPLSF